MCCLHNITNLLKAINDYVRLIIIVILDPQLLGFPVCEFVLAVKPTLTGAFYV